MICAAHGQCDHLDCRGGPFLIVFLEGSDREMHVYIYSSEDGTWSGPTNGPPFTSGRPFQMVPPALVGNALYFLIDATNSILEYDLAKQSVSHDGACRVGNRKGGELQTPALVDGDRS